MAHGSLLDGLRGPEGRPGPPRALRAKKVSMRDRFGILNLNGLWTDD